jgi:hypothetical protein
VPGSCRHRARSGRPRAAQPRRGEPPSGPPPTREGQRAAPGWRPLGARRQLGVIFRPGSVQRSQLAAPPPPGSVQQSQLAAIFRPGSVQKSQLAAPPPPRSVQRSQLAAIFRPRSVQRSQLAAPPLPRSVQRSQLAATPPTAIGSTIAAGCLWRRVFRGAIHSLDWASIKGGLRRAAVDRRQSAACGRSCSGCRVADVATATHLNQRAVSHTPEA